MADQPPLNEQEQADLVAFLDGELGGASARRLEAKLSLDPKVRAEADSLKKAWDLLDMLPRAEPSPMFTSKTLDRLTMSRPAAVAAKGTKPWRAWAVGLGWAASLILASYVAFSGFHRTEPGEPTETELAQELRLAENKRFYDLIDELELPHDQDRSDLFGEDTKAWLEALPDEDRKRVEEAGTKVERLKVIQDINDRQWLDRQPQRDREEILKIPEETRPAEVARLRRADRQRRAAWQKALQNPRAPVQKGVPHPLRLADFPTDVRTFVSEQLVPMLNDKEKAALDKAEGHWPTLALVILDLADHHPVLPAIHSPGPGVTHLRDLPQPVRAQLPAKGLGKGKMGSLRKFEGKWPDFALAVTEQVRREGKVLAPALGASRPREFSAAVQQFLDTKLVPILTDSDKARLKETEGKWPEYPKLLYELAHAHNLTIPGMSLPGPHEIWTAARSALPDVPDWVLHHFAVAELSSDERSRLEGYLTLADPVSRDRMKQEYFKKHPTELKKYRRLAIDRPPDSK